LRAGYFGAGLFNRVGGVFRAERFVEGETDGLDGDVRAAGTLEEGAERMSDVARTRRK